VAAGLVVFGVSFLPVSNFVMRIGTVMGERLLYLPSAGFLLVAAAGAVRLAGRAPAWRTAVAATAGLALLAGTARSLARCRDWKDNATLHASTLRTSPNSARAHFSLAPVRWQAGRKEEAIQLVRDAVRIDSTYTEAWTNLGGYLVQEGRYDEAREALRGAMIATPGDEYAVLALGALELEVGRPAEAIPWFERVVRANPRRVEAWYDLGLAHQALADTAAAIAAFRSAVAARPDAPDPDAQNNLAWLLVLTARTPAERQAAVAEARRSVAVRPDAASWDTLAEGLLRAGDRPGAVAAWRTVLELGASNPDSLRARLAELERN
jgi:tetratricopeptide (TPR) repeat protein